MSAGRPIRVLVVDDSAFARKVVRESLQRHPDLEVVGVAPDGLDALEKVSALAPDVVTLDMVMPHLDGVGTVKALAAMAAPPRVVLVSTLQEDNERVLEALQLGAVDFVQKPTALASARLYELGDSLVATVRAAAGARAIHTPPPPRPVSLAEAGPRAAEVGGLVVVGTSTGGPQALVTLMAHLPASLAWPVAIALHIPRGYTESLARRLDEHCALEVLEADDEMPLVPGRVLLARAGWHLKFERRKTEVVARLDLSPESALHRPSVDVLFESAAQQFGKDVLGVVMTGMGSDGLDGAQRVRAAGGGVLTQSAASCVIYGMPRCVDEAGLSSQSVRLEGLGARVGSWVEQAGGRK